MGPQVVHLPDGQNFTVTPVFAGLFFKSNELNTHHNPFPIGWTVVLNTEDDPEEDDAADDDGSGPNSRDGSDDGTIVPYPRRGRTPDGTPASTSPSRRSPRPASSNGNDVADSFGGLEIGGGRAARPRRRNIHAFRNPTLQNDNLFISSISNPSNTEFKPAASPTRQIAMMLWVTLYWYFHQPPPSQQLVTDASRTTPAEARPKGEWRINIKRDGVLRGRNLIPKLERMGLIATLESAVGTTLDDAGEGWAHMFVSRRMFWQIPGRLFLFTLQPTRGGSSFPGSPATSRPTSPVRNESPARPAGHHHHLANSPHGSGHFTGSDAGTGPIPTTLISAPSFPIGPFFSSSHLPTYYPPGPLVYTITGGVRHPLRPKPPRMGEIFYTRFVPSAGQFLSFRVASMSPRPVPYLGPVGPKPPEHGSHLTTLCDTSILQMWLANPRIASFWGPYVPDFLTRAVASRHSFPVIGMWDGVPFGYFEIYWVKEDILGCHLGADAGDFDRGLHVMVGEEWARGRVPVWLTSLAHWCWNADYRTMNVCLEPRVDNKRFIQHLEYTGFAKEKEISFTHKQSWFCRLKRENWEGPVL